MPRRFTGTPDITEEVLIRQGYIKHENLLGVVYYKNPDDPLNDWVENLDKPGTWRQIPWHLIENQFSPDVTPTSTRETAVGQAGREITATAMGEKIAAIYGRVRVGGDIFLQKLNNGVYRVGYGLGHGECDGIEAVTADFNNDPNYPFLSAGTYNGWKFKPGSVSQTASQIIADGYQIPLASTYIYPGLSYVAAFWLHDQVAMPDVPQPKFLVRGRKCYDPRLDGAFDPSINFTDPSPVSVVWTQNDALITADYLRNDWFGLGLGYDGVDWQSVWDAADYCDAIVGAGSVTSVDITGAGQTFLSTTTLTFTAAPVGGVTATAEAILAPFNSSVNQIIGIKITNPGSGYLVAPTLTASGFASAPSFTVHLGEPRHRMDIVIRRNATHKANLETLRAHFRCSFTERNGRIAFVIDSPRAIDHYFTKDNARAISGNSKGTSRVPSASILTWTNPKKDWVDDQDYKYTENCKNGIEEYRPAEWTLGGVTRANEAARNNAYLLGKERANLGLQIEFVMLSGLTIEKGDRANVVFDILAMPLGVDFTVGTVKDNGNGRFLCDVTYYNPALFADTVGVVESHINLGTGIETPEWPLSPGIVIASNDNPKLSFAPSPKRKRPTFGATGWSHIGMTSFVAANVDDGNKITVAGHVTTTDVLRLDAGTAINIAELEFWFSAIVPGVNAVLAIDRIRTSDNNWATSVTNFTGPNPIYQNYSAYGSNLTSIRQQGFAYGSHRYWEFRFFVDPTMTGGVDLTEFRVYTNEGVSPFIEGYNLYDIGSGTEQFVQRLPADHDYIANPVDVHTLIRPEPGAVYYATNRIAVRLRGVFPGGVLSDPLDFYGNWDYGVFIANAPATLAGAETLYNKSISAPLISSGTTSTTPAVDDNSTKIPNTAWYFGQASSTTPNAPGGAGAAGTSPRWMRADATIPTDTTKAAVASPTLTGSGTIVGNAGQPNYWRFDNTTNAGGKKWRVGDTGAAGVGVFSIYNETDGVIPLQFTPSGDATLSGATTSVGPAGTGTAPTTLSINGGSGAGGAVYFALTRNSIAKGYIGIAGQTDNVIIGMANDEMGIRAASKLLFSADNGASIAAKIDSSGNVELGKVNAGLVTLKGGRVKSSGTAPTVALVGVGWGTGATVALQTGSTDAAGTIVVTTGTGPSSGGSITLTFSTGPGAYGSNPPAVMCMALDGSVQFSAQVDVHASAVSTTAFTIVVDNNGTNLTPTSTYKIMYIAMAN